MKIPNHPIKRNESLLLDIVRIISAQMVLGGHLASFITGGKALIGNSIPIQNLGVVIFFILSGYLICKSISKYTTFGHFFIDRFSRIYTTLIPCLFLIAAMDFLIQLSGRYTHETAFNLRTFLGNIAMLQDHPLLILLKQPLDQPYPWITSFGSARPLWTLAVEWWLYMFAGWIFLAPRRSWWIFLFMAVVPVAHATISRGQGLTLIWMLGALLVFLPQPTISRKSLLVVAFGFSVLLLMRLSTSRDFYDFQANVFLAGVFGSLLFWSRGSQNLMNCPTLLVGVIRILAGASYALYILHYTIIELMMVLPLSKTAVALSSICLSNLLAVAIYLLFDRHHKKFGKLVEFFFTRYSKPGQPNLTQRRDKL